MGLSQLNIYMGRKQNSAHICVTCAGVRAVCYKNTVWADALFPSLSWKQFCMKERADFFHLVYGNMVKLGNKKEMPQFLILGVVAFSNMKSLSSNME